MERIFSIKIPHVKESFSYTLLTHVLLVTKFYRKRGYKTITLEKRKRNLDDWFAMSYTH